MTILNESGIPDVLPPLHAVNALAERLPEALVVVAGTRAEAHLVRSLSPAPANRRVVFAVLDPAYPPQQGQISSRIVEAAGARDVRHVLLVTGRAAQSLGMDAGFEARLAARRLELPVGVADLDAPYPTPGVLSTDLEDRALAALTDLCPKRRTSDLLETSGRPKRAGRWSGLLSREREETSGGYGRPVVLVGGTLSAGSVPALTDELSRAGVEVAGVLPAPGRELPPIGEGTVVAVLDPNLGTAAAVAGERGARVVRTLAPIGVDGTARFVQDVAQEAGARTSEVARARSVWEELGELRNRVRGKRIFFAGDTGFELPLARFLADAGAVVLEVGVPRLDRRFLASELHTLGSGVDVVISPDWRGQIARIEEARPDVVVASPGLRAPLVARGHLCRETRDFVRAGLHGYDGARRILELLDRTFERAEALDALNL